MTTEQEREAAFYARLNADPRFQEIERRLRHALIDGDQQAVERANEDLRALMAELRGH